MKNVFLSFSLKNSSVTEFFIEFSNQLSLNYKVFIITDTIEKNNFYLDSNIEILKWPSKRPTKLKDFLFVWKLIKKNKPQTMISNFGSVNLFLIVGFLLGVKQRIAWCHTLSAQVVNKPILRFRKKIVYKMATELIANSIATKSDLTINFGVDSNKVKIVPNAIRISGIKNRVIPYKLIYVGRMHVTKGVETLLRAMPYVVEKIPLANLTLIGEDLYGETIKTYKNIAQSLGVLNNVNFIGNKSRDEVLEHFSTSYVTIVPSVVEAFGYVIIESFSVRTPVIGSNTTGIAEIVRNNEDGFLFEPKNHRDLAEKIVYLMNEENLRSDFSKNCYQRFKSKYEIELVIEALFDTLKLQKSGGLNYE